MAVVGGEGVCPFAPRRLFHTQISPISLGFIRSTKRKVRGEIVERTSGNRQHMVRLNRASQLGGGAAGEVFEAVEWDVWNRGPRWRAENVGVVVCVVACGEGRDGGVSMERTHVRDLGRIQGSAWRIMARIHLFYLRLCHGN